MLCYWVMQVSVGMTAPLPATLPQAIPATEPIVFPQIPSVGLPFPAGIMDPNYPLMGMDYWMSWGYQMDLQFAPSPVLPVSPGDWMNLHAVGEPSRAVEWGTTFGEGIGIIDPPAPVSVPMLVPDFQQELVEPPDVPGLHLSGAMAAMGIFPGFGELADETDPTVQGPYLPLPPAVPWHQMQPGEDRVRALVDEVIGGVEAESSGQIGAPPTVPLEEYNRLWEAYDHLRGQNREMMSLRGSDGPDTEIRHTLRELIAAATYEVDAMLLGFSGEIDYRQAYRILRQMLLDLQGMVGPSWD